MVLDRYLYGDEGVLQTDNQGEPNPPSLSDPESNAESLESIREADDIFAAGDRGYRSAEEMFTAMGL